MKNQELYKIAKKLGGDNFIGIYNRILQMCKSVIDIDSQSFDLEGYSLKDKENFIKFLIEIVDGENSILGKEDDKKYPNRKIISNLKKEDVDILLDELIIKFLNKGYEYCNNSTFRPNFQNLKEEVTRISRQNAEKNIEVIRNNEVLNASEKYVKQSNLIFDYINKSLSELQQQRNNGMYNLLHGLYAIFLFENGYSHLFMQSIIYLVINNEKINDKLEAMNFIKQRIIEVGNSHIIKTERIVKENIFYDFATYVYYLNRRNDLKTYNDILIKLKNQMKEPYKLTVDEAYRCKKRFIYEVKNKNELRNIILEGENEKEERFNERFEDCQYLVVVLNIIAGRQLSAEYLQHIKVVYREIIDDKLKYNNKQSRTILRNLKRQEGYPTFDQIKDSYFIREKISRGLFREVGYACEYIVKNEVQCIFQNKVMEFYAIGDVICMGKEMRQYFSKLQKIMLECFQKFEI
ncbi:MULTISPECIES: hypothetical protein [Clostridium]|uniref:hypothetical protein n=1 Tax=Clostridium TaxID=1485 RepID=UPI0014019F41|nr:MULTISPECIES: hypothetical protein [Clostridium]MBY6915761.1 hypothetical protein [Clostridium botulinum]NFI53316.1 hypothetical protein [Clostridium botulinum]NFO39229.1 hypothetical protein [Clostridium botulinum]NFQ40151.1 hypothetical protein [Clostridium botulinum]